MIKKTYFVADDGTILLPEGRDAMAKGLRLCGDNKVAYRHALDEDLGYKYSQQTGHGLSTDLDTLTLDGLDKELGNPRIMQAEAEQALARIEQFKKDNAQYLAWLKDNMEQSQADNLRRLELTDDL